MNDKLLSTKFREALTTYQSAVSLKNSHNSQKWQFLEGIKALEKQVAWHEVDAKTQIAIINSHKKEIKAFEKQMKELKARRDNYFKADMAQQYKIKALEKKVDDLTNKYKKLLIEENAKLAAIIQDKRIAELKEANRITEKKLDISQVKLELSLAKLDIANTRKPYKSIGSQHKVFKLKS